MTSYRDPGEQLDLRTRGDGDVVAALALLWLASAVQVVATLLGHERFGAEATVALFVAVTLPCLWVARLVQGPIKNP